MSEETRRPGCFTRVFQGLDIFRKVVLNLVFFFLLFLFLILLFSGEDLPEVPDGGALVIAPQGAIVEKHTTDPAERAIAEALDDPILEVLLRDVLDGLEMAAEDDRIQAVVLDLNGLGSVGPSKLLEIEAALAKVREAGKTIVATADVYSQHAYYLAAQADEVFMHDVGLAVLQGYGAYPVYFREGLDRLGVDVNVFRVGTYKSAVEPFLRNDMSPEAEEANLDWLSDLWTVYVDGVAEAREIPAQAVRDTVQNLRAGLESRNGDTAQYALDTGFVDTIGSRQDFEDRMLELVGEDESGETFAQISLRDYLRAERLPDILPSQRRVAVLVAQGPIVDGRGDEASVGGESFAEQIRNARHDDSVKAIVLRVDSPGGSAFASELIRQELVAARAEGLPVVVSMSSVAASGGYWISTASDEIWALPNTITGSIGIFGIIPTFEDPMQEYLGANVDGVGTTDWAGAFRLDMELGEDAAAVIQLIIEKGYRDFLERVSESRGMTVEQVDEIAQGRVWSGQDALARGLVDELGGLEGAVARAAELADLEDFDVYYPQPDLDWIDQIFVDMSAKLLSRVGPRVLPTPTASGPVRDVYDWIARESRRLELFNDPRGAYAYCFCEVE